MPSSAAHYRTPPDQVRALGLAVTGAGWITAQDRPTPRRRLSGYAGVLVTAGSGYLRLHGRPGVFEVYAGAYFWLPPGVPHAYGPAGGTWDEHWVLFEGPAAARYEDLGYLGGGSAVTRPADPDAARRLAARLVDLTAAPATLANHVAAGAALHELICAVGGPVSATPGNSRDDLGRRALELLTADLRRPRRIGEIARELAVSSDTLIAAVRRLTGATPSQYLIGYRLDRAKALLADTDLPVGRIGERIGYPDPAYFARVFTGHTGIPPTAFREQSWRTGERAAARTDPVTGTTG